MTADPAACERRQTAQPVATHSSLDGSVALVVGASGGIGRAVSLALLHANAEVYLQGRSLASLRLPATDNRWPILPRYVVADPSADKAAEAVGREIEGRGRLDVLILSSGAYGRSRGTAEFADLLAANLLGPYALLQVLLPWLVKAQGQVVFMNSTQALKATGGVGQYAATKHALKAVADSLRDELNPQGVRVASMFLGRTATQMQEAIFAAEGQPYAPQRLLQPADVAEMVMAVLRLPRTAEVTDIVIRPMQKI